jgi:hypothetical protein
MNFREYQKQERLLEFVRDRLEGATKIAQKAREKAGPAQLTYWHFNAKVNLYKELIEKIKNNDNLELEKKFESLKQKINTHMGQRTFQQLMGEMEVLGEIANFD